VRLLSPETDFSEDAWNIAAENSSVKQEKEEEYIDIEDILAPPAPVESSKTGGKLKNKLKGGSVKSLLEIEKMSP